MPTDYQLMQLYRDWWKSSYATSPNSQAVVHAAAWAKHVLDTYADTIKHNPNETDSPV